jgi:hypothetical protein
MAGAGVFPKVTGDTIYYQDYNAIKSVIDGVVSTYYGNAVTSSAVSQGTTISAAQMDLLRADINKAYTHITGGNSAINDLATGGIIYKDDWNAYKTAADYCETNKNTVFAATQLGSAALSTSLTAAWNGAHTWTYTFTWPDAASANYYFNAGGYFVVDVSGTAPASSPSAKDTDWANNILNAIATQTYGNTQWDAGTNISVTEYGNAAQYLENYCQINITKTSTTVLTISVILNDADVGDQTGTGPAQDENVNTDAAASITRYFSQSAITVTSPTPSNTSNW